MLSETIQLRVPGGRFVGENRVDLISMEICELHSIRKQGIERLLLVSVKYRAIASILVSIPNVLRQFCVLVFA